MSYIILYCHTINGVHIILIEFLQRNAFKAGLISRTEKCVSCFNDLRYLSVKVEMGKNPHG